MNNAILSRQNANRQILQKLSEAIEAYPDWRFHQILQNLGIVKPNTDQYYEESVDTVCHIR